LEGESGKKTYIVGRIETTWRSLAKKGPGAVPMKEVKNLKGEGSLRKRKWRTGRCSRDKGLPAIKTIMDKRAENPLQPTAFPEI